MYFIFSSGFEYCICWYPKRVIVCFFSVETRLTSRWLQQRGGCTAPRQREKGELCFFYYNCRFHVMNVVCRDFILEFHIMLLQYYDISD